MPNDYPQVTIMSRQEWRDWLAAHHDANPGVWLVRYKQGSGHPHVSYNDVVEEALCFGWVDSRTRSLDCTRSQLLVTPRKPTSRWSASNKERIDRLTQDGLMAPAGLAVVQSAKRDGIGTPLTMSNN